MPPGLASGRLHVMVCNMGASLYEPINAYKPVAPNIGIVDGPFEYLTVGALEGRRCVRGELSALFVEKELEHLGAKVRHEHKAVRVVRANGMRIAGRRDDLERLADSAVSPAAHGERSAAATAQCPALP